VESNLYISQKRYIVFEGRIYVPFTEVERLVFVLSNKGYSSSYLTMVTWFKICFYMPEVSEQDMRYWFAIYGAPVASIGLCEEKLMLTGSND
jgi:hypothetical protein